MTLIIKYPLDLTGSSPTNRVFEEYKELPEGVINRVFCMDYGPFYTQGLILKDYQTQRVLDINVDYVPLHVIPQPTMRSGLEVCAAIAIINPAVSTEVTVTAFMVGGEYSFLTDVIIRLLDELELDNRPVNYGDLIGLPEAFLPSGHLHDLGDLYGFEYLVDAVYQVRDAILVGNQHYMDQLEARFQNIIDQVRADFNIGFEVFTEHMNNRNNPNEVTKAQVGLGQVEDYPPANPAEIAAGNATNRYLTVKNTMDWIFSQLKQPLDTHLAATGNVHGMVPADINLGNTPNYPAASNSDMLNPNLSPEKVATPAGIGALLALHGLGERVLLTSSNNLDTLDRSGRFWYNNNNRPVNSLPNTNNDGVSFIELDAVRNGQGVMTAKVQRGYNLQTGEQFWRRTVLISGAWVYMDWEPA